MISTHTEWGDWFPYQSSSPLPVEDAPGVYQVRRAATGDVVYVGMDGSVRARLYRYRTGQGFTGLTQALLDEAIRDGFVASWKPQPDSIVRPSVQLMHAVLDRADLEVSVTYTANRETARALEASTYIALLERGEALLNVQPLHVRSEE
ncbi:hypothetical protein [Mycobacterium sp.]|uniref:hypothetical protein n=1 Tax=Mycobacterium sp. TaxID=1785 RepID=UPI003F9D2B58